MGSGGAGLPDGAGSLDADRRDRPQQLLEALVHETRPVGGHELIVRATLCCRTAERVGLWITLRLRRGEDSRFGRVFIDYLVKD